MTADFTVLQNIVLDERLMCNGLLTQTDKDAEETS